MLREALTYSTMSCKTNHPDHTKNVARKASVGLNGHNKTYIRIAAGKGGDILDAPKDQLPSTP